ncbi:MAG TPA: hypothetical protein VFS25_23690 [Chitinophaga sp.]|uniref:hypothetical protein n=1 Tax=Chitinophaga sp. TaxID=1869181 RepID=UPI002DBDD956|nr:hypothetical protein [Chitinophaga sp.]HEU4555868.1 hypothetical protein [Chitinophaga sp.]
MCETRMLAHKGHTHIGHCMQCKTVFLWHGNVLLNFTPDDFIHFSKALNRGKFSECALPFPDNQERVIVHTPCYDISFTFTRAEWEVMVATVQEALLMQEVYTLV